MWIVNSTINPLKYLNGDQTDKDHPVIKRYIATKFKRLDPLNIERENIFK